jgi:hypothetical protein
MPSGFTLSLMIGPAVPVPVPQSVIDALTQATVTTGGERGGFQLTFTVGKKSPLLTTMLPAGYLDPIVTRVILVVSLGGQPTVLMDGIVTRQELAPSNEPGQSTLTVTGEDLSVLMDLVEMPFMRFPAMPVIARVNLILAKYLVLGIVPLVIPPIFMDVPIPTKEIPSQTGTDRAYIKSLATECGYTFVVEPGPAPGANIAYFGPDIRVPVPQPALNVNTDAFNNVDSISFSLDGLAKKIVVLTIMDPVTGKIPIPVPIPNINILHPPLGARLTPPARVSFANDVAKEKLPAAANKALKLLREGADAITGTGVVDTLRYGRVLKSRQLVGVRGAGLAYDGMYYVNGVTHTIKRGEYKQNFNISRDGLISPTPAVMP